MNESFSGLGQEGIDNDNVQKKKTVIIQTVSFFLKLNFTKRSHARFIE